MSRIHSSMIVANVVFAIACSTPDATHEEVDAATTDPGSDAGTSADSADSGQDAGSLDADGDVDAAADASLTACDPGTVRPCCAARGTETCGAIGTWDACTVAPSAEVCDGVDNDCDGTTDESLKKACLVDADDDGYAGGTTPVEVCRDGIRVLQGQCPVGFVDAATSSGADCNDADAALYRPMQTQVDHDADRYCNSDPRWTCMGETTPPGLRLASYCLSSTDCDDEDDQAKTWRDLRNDADADGYCAPGAAAHVCTTSYAPLGTRDASNCGADDCNDVDGNTYRVVSLRTDADGDTFCTAAAAVDTCIGAAVPAGKRVASTCYATNDCADGNPWAASSCTTNVVSNSYDKYCDVGQYVTTNWALSWTCPTGFHTSSAQWNDTNGNDGDDAYYTAESYDFANSSAHSDFVCRTAAIGHDYYFVSVTCVAN